MSDNVRRGYGRKRLLDWEEKSEGPKSGSCTDSIGSFIDEPKTETPSEFAEQLADAATRDRGERPAGYTKAAICKECGLVWMPPQSADYLEVCAWCVNRIEGKPIPRPERVSAYRAKRRREKEAGEKLSALAEKISRRAS